MKKLSKVQSEQLKQINESEVKQSKKNLSNITKIFGIECKVLSLISSSLCDCYLEEDRRYYAFDEVMTKVDEALKALDKLRAYELETINLCTGKEEVFVMK